MTLTYSSLQLPQAAKVRPPREDTPADPPPWGTSAKLVGMTGGVAALGALASAKKIGSGTGQAFVGGLAGAVFVLAGLWSFQTAPAVASMGGAVLGAAVGAATRRGPNAVAGLGAAGAALGFGIAGFIGHQQARSTMREWERKAEPHVRDSPTVARIADSLYDQALKGWDANGDGVLTYSGTKRSELSHPIKPRRVGGYVDRWRSLAFPDHVDPTKRRDGKPETLTRRDMHSIVRAFDDNGNSRIDELLYYESTRGPRRDVPDSEFSERGTLNSWWIAD